MAEYINREETKRELSEWCISLNNPHLLSRDDTMFLLDNIPAADVAPVVHGRWIEYQIPHVICCSNCDWATDAAEKNFQYCPMCGARMDGGDESETD